MMRGIILWRKPPWIDWGEISRTGKERRGYLCDFHLGECYSATYFHLTLRAWCVGLGWRLGIHIFSKLWPKTRICRFKNTKCLAAWPPARLSKAYAGFPLLLRPFLENSSGKRVSSFTGSLFIAKDNFFFREVAPICQAITRFHHNTSTQHTEERLLHSMGPKYHSFWSPDCPTSSSQKNCLLDPTDSECCFLLLGLSLLMCHWILVHGDQHLNSCFS